MALAIMASGVWLVGWPESYSRIVLSRDMSRRPRLWAFLARSSKRLRAAGFALILYGGGIGGLALLAASKGVDISGIHR